MSNINRLHPSALFIYFMTVILLPMFVPNPVILSLSLCGGILCLFSVKSSRKKSIIYYFLLLLLITAINPLFSHSGKTELFFINNSAVTLEAIIYGAVSGGMIVSVLIWFKSFTAVMTGEKLLHILGRIAPKVSMILTSAFRYIPLFNRQYEKTKMTQTAMGLYSSDSVTDKLKSASRVFSAITTWSFENSIDTADSMRARGYGIKNRSHFTIYKKRISDRIFTLINLILAISSITFAFIGNITMEFYPSVIMPASNTFVILCYSSYGLLAFMPFILEIKEALKWKYLMSKI